MGKELLAVHFAPCFFFPERTLLMGKGDDFEEKKKEKRFVNKKSINK